MSSVKTSWFGIISVLIAVVLWSTAEVVTRTVVYDISPLQLAAARFVIGSAILLPFLPRELRRRNLRPNRAILFHSAWIALIGVVLSSVTYQLALRHAGAGLVATVFGASPLMVMLLAVPLLREPVTWPKALGLTVGFLGIVAMGFGKPSATFTLWGLFLAVSTALCFAAFTVLVKRFAGAFAGLPVTVFCSLIGAAYLVAMAAIEWDGAGLAHLGRIWLPVLYLAVGPTGLAYLFFFSGLEHVEATQAASLVLLKPPLATVLAAVFLHERVTWSLGLAMFLIIGGLYLVVMLSRLRARRIARGEA